MVAFFEHHLVNGEGIGTVNIQSSLNAESKTFHPLKKSP